MIISMDAKGHFKLQVSLTKAFNKLEIGTSLM